MEKIKKYILPWWIMTICFLLFLPAFTQAQEETSAPEMELFVFNACESCQEGKKFEEILRIAFADAQKEGPSVYKYYNVFHETERKYFQKRLQNLGMEVTLEDIPVVVWNEQVFQGTYEEIAKKLVGTYEKKNEAVPIYDETQPDQEMVLSELQNFPDQEIGFILFTTSSCDSCHEAVDMIGQRTYFTINIMIGDGLALLDKLNEFYQVPESEQKVPILFYKNGYLSGVKKIREHFSEVLADDRNKGSWTELSLSGSEEKGQTEKQSWWRIVVTGFANGLNPCGISMLLMVLSLLVNTESGFLAGSLSFLSGKFLAYLCMGTGAFCLFSTVETSGFRLLEKGLTGGFAFLALLIGILNLVDFWNVNRKEYGKVIVQLPAALRRKNHEWISNLKKVPKKWVIPSCLGLGILISLGEFFCTGQLYAASVLYMVRSRNGISVEVLSMLGLYVAAMCLPLLILIVVIQKSKNMMSVSKVTLQGMPAIKLINAVLFIVLAWLLARTAF